MTLAVNERFGQGRVLKYPSRSFKISFYSFRLIIKDKWIFTKNLYQKMCETAKSKD
jgi:hypothetical protein